MFKPWKSDKTKIKAMFRLHLLATQVPKLKKPNLSVALVPDNAGKPTVKLDKGAVQDGTCVWEHPVLETVKLIKETKTGKFHEKIYHFIVSAGSSKSGFLGEASIDFADFTEQTKPVTISLPLKFANSGAVLHVTIQKMQGTDQSEAEENGYPTEDRSLKNQLSNVSDDYLEDEQQYDECFREDAEPNLREPDLVPGKNSGNPRRSFGTMLKKTSHRRSQTEWSLGSASDGSFGDSMNNGDEHAPRGRSRESPDDCIEQMKSEIDSLTRQSTLSELELQSLRKQVVKETKRGQNLSMEVSSLKEERDMLKKQCEELQSSSLNYRELETSRVLQTKYEEAKAQLDEFRYELDHERDLKANLRLQLQKTQDSNSELILEIADLEEAVKDKDREISCLSTKIQNYEDLEEIEKRRGKDQLLQDNAEVGKLKQKIVKLSNEIEVRERRNKELQMKLEDITIECETLKQENSDISTALEEMNHREEKTKQGERLRCIGGIREPELEAQIEKLEEIVRKQGQELSESFVSINELETQLKSLEKEMDLQAYRFEEELEAMTQAKVEQEQRAIRAEEALRKTRWKNAVTAERLQEEFKRLSVEMDSKFDENEKVAAKAVAESNELRQQKRTLEENLQKANEEIILVRDQNAVKLRDLYDQIASKALQIEQISGQLDIKAQQLEQLQQENERITKAFSMEMQILSSEVECMRKKNSKLKEQSEQAAKVREDKRRAEMEIQMRQWKVERDDLQRKLSSAKKDAEEATKELTSLRLLMEEREKMLENLKSEVRFLVAEQNDLKEKLLNEEGEKQKLRDQIREFHSEMRKRVEEHSISEKKSINNSNGKQSYSTPNYQKNVALLKEKVGLLKVQIGLHENAGFPVLSSGDESSIRDIIKEVERSMEHLRSSFSSDKSLKVANELNVLKERNKEMEKELKDMEERYSEISLRFAEVEGERQQLVMALRNLKNNSKKS